MAFRKIPKVRKHVYLTQTSLNWLERTATKEESAVGAVVDRLVREEKARTRKPRTRAA